MYKALLKAGMDEALATLAADEITEPDQVTTKSDLLEMKVEEALNKPIPDLSEHAIQKCDFCIAHKFND